MGIRKNSAQCDHCGDIIESKHRHDWVACSCGDDPTCENETKRLHGIFVDGGHIYIRHGGADMSEYHDLSEEE